MGEHLNVVADLRLEVVGGVSAQVSGDGDRLRVTTDHPTRLLRHASGLTRALDSINGAVGAPQQGLGGPAATIAARLADAGLTVTVAGPRRDIVHVGADAGSRHVRLAVPARIGQAAAGLVTAALVVLVVRTRRR